MTDNKLSKQEIHSGRGITENVDQLLHDPPNATYKGHLRDVNDDLTRRHEHDEGDGELLSPSGNHLCNVHYALEVSTGITGKCEFRSPRIERQ